MRQITIDEIEQAYPSVSSEIIEDYPDDPRGHSALVLAFTDLQDRCMPCGQFMKA